MRSNKKGDLAISTNAIVVLIIAVIMLGLIIGFVRTGFSKVSDQFFQKVDSETPDPAKPSASTPITVSAESILTHQGDQFGMKIAVFNPDPSTAMSDLQPTIGCIDSAVTPSTPATGGTFKHTIAPKTDWTFTYIGTIPKGATLGKNLCQVTAGSLTKDIIIEVQK